jgi:hypothetical protein
MSRSRVGISWIASHHLQTMVMRRRVMRVELGSNAPAFVRCKGPSRAALPEPALQPNEKSRVHLLTRCRWSNHETTAAPCRLTARSARHCSAGRFGPALQAPAFCPRDRLGVRRGLVVQGNALLSRSLRLPRYPASRDSASRDSASRDSASRDSVNRTQPAVSRASRPAVPVINLTRHILTQT